MMHDEISRLDLSSSLVFLGLLGQLAQVTLWAALFKKPKRKM